ncbi:DEHA2D14102p [Debaryomyces hansenii CBS767]|uniref:DEHA2D14102p n=1 Tax=Debaryomyces hansenii (strain ATCC 36239 / CBS 767 / BCRC 21394 / JCM 1990 / NBRC 0083 / IGC 2968) TaxID=284592 RepID=Q6BRS9_DEBHA|nr:DEHA2D14102p [Debaryomyces hansenii CBS767]CAG87259.2 DEHA2D14102p [Debaryomyces hansenii CBS767]|eukprot:XP_459091.2 DEHA2D14102p [Debaryomyces hansenii CBS767]
MTDDKIKFAVHNCIKTYELTSKSKRFSRLTFEHESKIAKSINLNHKEKFLDILSKRDHYIGKLNKLLNDSITDEADHSSKGQNRLVAGPDPRYITNRHHAKQYIINNVLPNTNKSQIIEQLISKHSKLQDNYKESRESILKGHKDSIKNLQPNTKLSKLSNINAQIKDHSINNKRVELTNELDALDDMIIFNSKQYSIETYETLQSLKIPYFFIDEMYKYPQLDDDRVYMLDLLVDLLTEKKPVNR